MRSIIKHIFQQEDINFLLTNRIPRILLTRWMGRFSKVESPLLVRCAIAIWRLFAELDLSEAEQSRFTSIHACFTRKLKAGARTIDPRQTILTSPCDAIIGAFGSVNEGELIQAKGFPYHLQDLLPDAGLVARHLHGKFITLRLTSGMYHRFHAPYDCQMRHVSYISGDTWNVNPITLQRVEQLFCKNERAIIQTHLLPHQEPVTLVAVAAILVASIRLHGLATVLDLGYPGPNEMSCQQRYAKGEEMGWFEHGSTIIVFAPATFEFTEAIQTGTRIRMGQALLAMPV